MTAMTPARLAEIRAIEADARPGPWQWFGNMKMREIDLATVDRGRTFVMQFVRWGMHAGQPRFQNQGEGFMRSLEELDQRGPIMIGSHRNDFVGIAHPDARFIAESRAIVPELLAEIDRLRERSETAESNYQFMVDRAADAKLDGYRELGERAARAENERDHLKRAVRAALGAWCPRDPGGDGADGEAYQLCMAALEGRGR